MIQTMKKCWHIFYRILINYYDRIVYDFRLVWYHNYVKNMYHSRSTIFFWIQKKKILCKILILKEFFCGIIFNKRNIYSQRFIATLSVPIPMCILTQAIFNAPNVDIEFLVCGPRSRHTIMKYVCDFT